MRVTLSDELVRSARARASELGVSVAEYVRRLIARDADDDGALKPDPSSLFDLGDSGDSDVAREEERHLRDAFEAIR